MLPVVPRGRRLVVDVGSSLVVVVVVILDMVFVGGGDVEVSTAVGAFGAPDGVV